MPRRSTLILFLPLLALLAASLADCRRERKPEEVPSTPLKFIFTADTAGALDPCG